MPVRKTGRKEKRKEKMLNSFQIPALKFSCLMQQKFEHPVCNRYCMGARYTGLNKMVKIPALMDLIIGMESQYRVHWIAEKTKQRNKTGKRNRKSMCRRAARILNKGASKGLTEGVIF